MLQRTIEKLRAIHLEQKVNQSVNSSIYDLPFESNSFDCVVSLNVFNHLENIDLALRQCARLLKPGGEFLFNYPNLYSYFWPVAVRINQTSKAVGQNVYSKWLKPVEVEDKLQSVGFEIKKRVGHLHVPRSLENLRVYPILYRLDRISRHQPFQRFAPVHFCLCRKIA
jgi:2-polyprenyl-3-methyl-5-hydroxy-6-metoxy-1,4-benzoquinol methylase